MINTHVDEPVCVNLSFPVTDRLWDLRLAFWETQLHEQYPTAKIHAQWDLNHNQAHVQIEFDNAYDAAHWHLLNHTSQYASQLLTYCTHMLAWCHEKENSPNIC